MRHLQGEDLEGCLPPGGPFEGAAALPAQPDGEGAAAGTGAGSGEEEEEEEEEEWMEEEKWEEEELRRGFGTVPVKGGRAVCKWCRRGYLPWPLHAYSLPLVFPVPATLLHVMPFSFMCVCAERLPEAACRGQEAGQGGVRKGPSARKGGVGEGDRVEDAGHQGCREEAGGEFGTVCLKSWRVRKKGCGEHSCPCTSLPSHTLSTPPHRLQLEEMAAQIKAVTDEKEKWVQKCIQGEQAVKRLNETVAQMHRQLESLQAQVGHRRLGFLWVSGVWGEGRSETGL
jgi:hypothetical protein